MEEKIFEGKRLYIVTNNDKAKELAKCYFSGDINIPTDALFIIYHIKNEFYITHIHMIKHNDSFETALFSLNKELLTNQFFGYQNDEKLRQILNDQTFSLRKTLLDFVENQLSKI